jgi:hypothetical protein
LRPSVSAVCADGDYQPSLGVLGVPLIMVPDTIHDVVFVHHLVRTMHHVVYSSHAMTASSSSTSFVHSRSRHNAHNARPINVPNIKKKSSTSPSISYRTFDVSYVLYCKSSKVVVSHVGPKCKNGKTCVLVLKIYVTKLT